MGVHSPNPTRWHRTQIPRLHPTLARLRAGNPQVPHVRHVQVHLLVPDDLEGGRGQVPLATDLLRTGEPGDRRVQVDDLSGPHVDVALDRLTGSLLLFQVHQDALLGVAPDPERLVAHHLQDAQSLELGVLVDQIVQLVRLAERQAGDDLSPSQPETPQCPARSGTDDDEAHDEFDQNERHQPPTEPVRVPGDDSDHVDSLTPWCACRAPTSTLGSGHASPRRDGNTIESRHGHGARPRNSVLGARDRPRRRP